MNCITIDPEILKDISNKTVSGKSISWIFIERICYSFDDILVIVNHCLLIGAIFNGIPSEKTIKFLSDKGINMRNIQ